MKTIQATHTRSTILILGILVFSFLPFVSWAIDEVDGIYYELNSSDRTAEVTYSHQGINYSGKVVIPKSFVLDGITYSVTSIGEYAFEGCTDLTSVTIPTSVKTLGEYAFYGCTGLTSVTIPNSVTSLGRKVFQGCTGLTSVKISNQLATISEDAFCDCTGLTSVTIPNGVTTLDSHCFSRCTSLTSITIPSSVNEFGFGVFSGCTGFTTFEIPKTITHLRSTFANCTGLTSITIPENVTYIDDAFAGCKGLTSLIIPNSVDTIDTYSFSNCTGLTSMKIPKSVTYIGGSIFYGCSGLTSISVDADNPVYDSRNNCNAIIETATNTLMAGCQNTVIPNGVTKIEHRAFFGCTGLESIKIPSTVTEISHFAFCESGLTSISIPSSVNTLGNGAFSGCLNLSSINVNSGNTTYDSRNNCNAIIKTSSNKIVGACKNTVIPDDVTKIGDYAFFELSNISSVTIPNGVTEIGLSAFNGCTGLTSVSIPNSVTIIGYQAFDDCVGLTSMSIPYGVTSIYEFAFNQCTGLTSISFPKTLTFLADWALEGCTNLEIIKVANPTPFSVTGLTFYPVNQESCKLYVPIGSKAIYENERFWNNFQDIIEYEPDTEIAALSNAIYVDQTDGRIGGTMDIPVKLKSDFAVRGFQFTMELPEGTTVNSWKLSTDRLPSGATESDKISSQGIDGNKISVACSLNYEGKTFTGNDGVVATVNVTFSEDMEEGSYPIYLTECSSSDATGYKNPELSDVKSTLFLESYVPGDANGDGRVMIGDVTAILNYIVGVSTDTLHLKAADVNGDGKVLIGDVIAILNLIVDQ